MIISYLKRLITDPGKNIPLVNKWLQKQLCVVFKNSAYFMQGQMSLHPASRWYDKEFVEITGGYFLRNDSVQRKIHSLQHYDYVRRNMLILLLRTIEEQKISGDFAELGVYKGATARLFHHYSPNRKLHLFDTFEGFTKKGVDSEKNNMNNDVSIDVFSDTSLSIVKENIMPQNNNVYFYKGYFPESVTDELENKRFSFVHLDADLYEPTFNGLTFFYPRMSVNGVIVIHDYNAWVGARKAVDDFLRDKEEFAIPMVDLSGSAIIVKK